MMKYVLKLLTLLMLLCPSVATSEAPRVNAPKWCLLGDDEQLKELVTESEHVVLVCVYKTDAQKIVGTRHKISHGVTVVKVYKGDCNIGDKIKVVLMADNIPLDEQEKVVFLEKANEKIEGDLRIAFLKKKDDYYSTEYMKFPAFTLEMDLFLAMLDAKS